MGRTIAYRGVYARETSILVEFSWRRHRYRETVRLPPTPANLKYADRLRQEILRKIELGAFNFADYFPESKTLSRLGLTAAPSPTFAELAEQWLTIKRAALAETTWQEYRNALRQHFLPAFGARRVAELGYDELMLTVAGIPWANAKTRNNCLIPLRGVLAYAFKAKKMPANLAPELESARLQKPKPDPLTLDEVEAILAHLATRYPGPVVNYFEFDFFTGLRPSEMIALPWDGVDFRTETARIDRARVRGRDKDTKTHEARDVELNSRALAALVRQKAETFLAGGVVFLNPATGRPFVDTSAAIERYWHPTLKALGIRTRDARQARHTYATLGLMAGINPAYISRQMGHTNAKMFYEVYSKWIDGADKSREKNRMNAFINVTRIPLKNSGGA